MDARGALRIGYGIMAGTLIYMPLVLLPIAGPLYAGVYAGRKARTSPLGGLTVGVSCALLGYLFWISVVFPCLNLRPDGLLSGIFWLAFLGWNVFCGLLSGVGGMMGAMLSYSEKGYNACRTGRARTTDQDEKIPPAAPRAPTFIVCPACGTGNQEDAARCKSCGQEI